MKLLCPQLLRMKYICVHENQAQATVEMAVVAPVLIVLALVTYNLMSFTAATARFDRVAPDVVLAHGVSPAGDEGASTVSTVTTVQDKLVQAMEGYNVQIEVTCSDETGANTNLLELVGSLRTFTCTMRFTPWPNSFSIAGVSMGAPALLSHERIVTVDPWRSGVIV